MESFRLSLPAERDLLELHEHLARTDGLARALGLETEMLSAIRQLVRMPGMGHRRPDLDPSLRFWPVHRWLIVYRPESVPLEIVRVLGGWLDLPRVLGQSR